MDMIIALQMGTAGRRTPPLRIWLAVVLYALVMITAGAATAAAPPFAHEQSDLRPDPALVFGRLDNGLRYVLMVNRTPRDRVSLHLDIQAGSLSETDDQRGLAHFLEHMAFNGSTHFPPGELVKYFQRIGMAFGDDANAHTGFDETVYDVLLPGGDRESLAEGLLVLYDYAQGALLSEAEIQRERDVVLAEMRTRDSPGYRTFAATLGFAFEGLRIARRLPIGDRQVIEQTDHRRLKAFYDTWYRPDRMVLVMVGDFDPELAREMIRARFADLTARTGTCPDPPMGSLNHQGVKTFYHNEPELGHVSVSIEQVRRIPAQRDTVDRRRRQIAEEMASRILDHRLQAVLARPDPPYTDAGVSSGVFLKTLRYAEINARTQPEKWSAALAVIEQSLRQALAYGFDPAEVDRVRRDLLAELDKAVSQAATRQSPDLAAEIIRQINTDRVILSPEQERDLLAPVIRSLTPAAIHDALKQAWAADHYLVMVSGSVDLAEAGPPPAETIGRVFAASRAAPVSAPVPAEAVNFPYLPTPLDPGAVVQRIDHEDLGVVQVAFANGLRLSLKPTDFKDNEVLVSLDLDSGRAAEPVDKPGLAELAEQVLNESGLGALTREALERALSGRNAALHLAVTEDRLRLVGEAVTGELELLFELLRHQLVDPGWRRTAFNLVMARFEQQYADLSRSVDGQMMLQGRRFLAGGDSRFGLPPIETLRRLTMDDLRRWAAPILTAAPMELAVVGDFDVARVIDLAARHLGSLPDRKPPPDDARPGPRFPAGRHLDLAVDTQLEKGLAVVAYATEDLWDIGRTRRLSLLAEVFSDRLREQIREKLGASYSPFVHSWTSRAYDGYGLMSAFVQVDPGQVETVVLEIDRISADLATNGVGADEFRRTREPSLTSIKDMRRQNGYWLNTVLAGAWRHPQQLAWSRTIVADYAAVRAEELSALASRYLVPARRATVRITPRRAPGP